MGVAFGFALMLFLVAIGVGRDGARARNTFSGTVRWVGRRIPDLASMEHRLGTGRKRRDVRQTPYRDGATAPDSSARHSFSGSTRKPGSSASAQFQRTLSPGEDLVVQATTFAMVFLVAGFAGSFPWLAFGSFVRRALRDPGHARAFNIAMAVLLVMAMDSRRASRTARVSEIDAQSSIAHESRFDR